MESDNMKKALQSRRGNGLDVSIIVGPHAELGGTKDGVSPTGKEYSEDRAADAAKSDLAPPPDSPLDVDHSAGVPSPHLMGHSELSEMKDSDLLAGMSEYDKSHISDRAPRSLGERARKEMILSATAAKK